MKKGKWRLEPLPLRKISPNLSKRRTKGPKLFSMVYRTLGGEIHSPTDLYSGQLLWCRESRQAWVDLAPQCIDMAVSPEDALETALSCISLKDLSYVENRYWDPEGPITPLEYHTGKELRWTKFIMKPKPRNR